MHIASTSFNGNRSTGSRNVGTACRRI